MTCRRPSWMRQVMRHCMQIDRGHMEADGWALIGYCYVITSDFVGIS